LTQKVAILTGDLLACLSLALPADKSLVDTHSECRFVQSLIHYPKRSHSHSQTCRNPAHTDFGSLTLIFQDGTPGLEVLDISGKGMEAETSERLTFLPVDPDPNLIFVNTGYLLERWTAGQWKGVQHRVCETTEWPKDSIGPEPSGQSWERYSIAFFAAFNPETVIESGNKAALHVGSYLAKKRASMYSN
jgi:isopenicillin N synthase-like dioxygenase